ncbi:thiosulfate sulfurtransferase GlpE [Thalassotalea agarivorans]|uniref:Thiosulfate sulfurtransferase GlpE n=1 Tax=Thalassotalea agarivorans TaxID=349064 RepID=A0A1I0CNH2_THASX|nr:thiosulfate sulfurtransferase GlpE [Thalassotalea agarivorans]SET21036.1 thiosulfate sulfurtransferase [Thalassotalea agarivorans]
MTSFQHMNVAQLHERLNEESLVIVDIRDPNTFAQGRVTKSQHLTNDNLADFLREADLDAPTVVVCYHGNSSQQAADFLASQDFTEVYSLDGGFTQWQLVYPEHVEK